MRYNANMDTIEMTHSEYRSSRNATIGLWFMGTLMGGVLLASGLSERNYYIVLIGAVVACVFLYSLWELRTSDSAFLTGEYDNYRCPDDSSPDVKARGL